MKAQHENGPPDDEPPSQSNPRLLVRYGGLGVELAGAIIGLTLLGLWIDHHFGTGRTATLVGAAIGIVGGLYNFLRQALELSKTQLPPSGGEKDESDNHPTTGQP